MGKLQQGVNDLYTWCLSNGEFGQMLIDEWTGIDDKGNEFNISEISFGSHRNMIWKCSKGHKWYARISNRTCHKQLCRTCSCNNRGTSYPEQFLYWALKQIYPKAISRGRYQGIEYDITIPEERTCIEYSPTRWHADKKEKDSLKADICKQHNVRLIYIREDSDGEYDETWSSNYICFHIKQSKREEYCSRVLEHILQSFGHSISEIDIDLVRKNAFEYSQDKIEYNKSLEYKYQELSKEWNYKLNKIDIKDISSGTNIKVFWTCINCKYGIDGEWQATPHRRTAKGYETGCPQCGYNWYKAQTGQPQRLKKGYELKVSEPVQMVPKTRV